MRLGGRPYERRLWVVNGLLSFTVSYGIVYWAEQWIPSGLAAVLYATFPLWVAVLAHYWLPGERLTWRGLFGVLVGLAGVAWIFADDLSSLGGTGVTTAASIMLVSPMASAVANVAIKRWGGELDPLSLTAVPMAICAVLTGALALIFERHATLTWTGENITALLYLAIAGSAVTFTLYFWLLSFLPATRLALITYAIPVVAVCIGIAWMGESLTVGVFGGTVLILLGTGLAMRGRNASTRRPPDHPTR